VVGTGGAVRPLTLCLSAQGPRCTDPTVAPAFDGLKISVSRRVAFNDRSLLGSFILRTAQRAVQPMSQPTGNFRSAPQSGSYGALVAPSTEMSCMTIYLRQLLEHMRSHVSGGRGQRLLAICPPLLLQERPNCCIAMNCRFVP
jgi:hypothetical protein